MNKDMEFLDLLSIVSFSLQMHLMEQTEREASNNAVLNHLHQDLTVIDKKLNLILEHLDISLSETS